VEIRRRERSSGEAVERGIMDESVGGCGGNGKLR
jgi:hypothetical protein